MLHRWMLAALVAIGLCPVPRAEAQAPTEPGWTRLVNAAWSEVKGTRLGQCIAVPYSTKAPGTVVEMQACGNGENQFFQLLDGNFANSRIAVYRGADQRCLGYEPEGGKINITDCGGAPRWRSTSTGEIATTDLRSCVRVPDDGRPELVDNCAPFFPEPRTAFGSNWHIETLGHPLGHAVVLVNDQFGDCIDVATGARSPGVFTIHYACHGRPNQAFQLRGTKHEVFLTVFTGGEMLCVSDVSGGSLDYLLVVPCDRTDRRQAWEPSLLDGGPSRLVNVLTRRCLDGFLDSQGVGALGCTGGRNQGWLFVKH